MPIVRNKKNIRVQTFNAGEDSSSDPTAVSPAFATLLRGCEASDRGKVNQRLGPSRTGDNPDILIADIRFHDSAPTDFEGNILSTNVSATSVTYVDGKFGNAANFNGSTSNIVIAAAETEISANTMGAFVISAWMYINSDGENDNGHVFDKSNASTYNGAITVGYKGWVHNENASTVKLGFEVSYSTTNAQVLTSSNFPIETWTKVEFFHNADKSLDIYINGVLASYSTDTTGAGTLVDDTTTVFTIGNSLNGDGALDGRLEYLRVYDGALTSTQYEQDKIYGLTRFKIGSTIDRVYRIRDTNLERLDDDFKGWTEIDTGFTADSETNFVQAGDKLFILNGADNVHSMATNEVITDESNTNTDPVTKSKVGAWAQNNRLFVSTGSATESTRDVIYFSGTNTPQTFDLATNQFRVVSRKSSSITWMESFKLNELVIYKEDAIFVLNMTGSTPLTDWTLQPINVAVGCKAGRTVKDVGNDHIFLDDQGFVRLLSRTTFDKLLTSVISGPVQSILDEINIDAIEKSCAEFINAKYYLSIPTGSATENNVTLIWDSEAAALTGDPASGWSVVESGLWYPAIYSSMEFGDNKIRLIHGDNRQISTVYKHDANTDNGKTIDMQVAGPAHDFGDRSSDKIFGPLHCVWASGENTTVEMLAEIDEQGFESLGTFSLAGSAPILPIDLPFTLSASSKTTELLHVKQLGRGKTCRIKARHNQYNNTATFIEYELFSERRIPKQ